MPPLTDESLLSIENECLTVVYGSREERPAPAAIRAVLERLGQLAPSLPSPSGVANGYGIVYPDPTGHFELTAVECDSPYLLPIVVEQQEQLVRAAVEQLLHDKGIRMILANNTYYGLFQPKHCATWGAHSNYLVEERPSLFGSRILPFLATRIYAGAGVVQYPDGRFLASSRAPCMECDTGGGTTERRAVHSTARDESHMGPNVQRWRYHLICGDGHRSHFNLALQFGCTLAALKAVLFNPRLPDRLPRFCRDGSIPSWTAKMQELNVLARLGEPLRVDPRVIEVQRVYLEGAREYAAARSGRPAWLPRLLADWDDTLRAMERRDDDWLSARLDPWIKYNLFSRVLAAGGHAWKDLRRSADLFAELTLLDQNYHEFTNPESVFYLLQRQGVLHHRVADAIPPGGEPEPYVPDTTTRGRARARFIREHAGNTQMVVDWAAVTDSRNNRRRRLPEPFARHYEPWEEMPEDFLRAGGGARLGDLFLESQSLEQAQLAYERGDFETAHRQLAFLEVHGWRARETDEGAILRYRAWIQSRRGRSDGAEFLNALYRGHVVTVTSVTDYLAVYRFRSLDLPPEIQPWLEYGRGLLRQADANAEGPLDGLALREHLAYAMIRQEQFHEAVALLEPAWRQAASGAEGPRIQGRLLATLGDAYRLLGRPWRARACLRDALQLLDPRRFLGERADFAWTGLAKLTQSRQRALGWLANAKEAQTNQGNPIGLARTLLLEARRCGDPVRAAANREQIVGLRARIPSLGACCLLGRILEQWDQWLSEDGAGGRSDAYWGL